MDNEAKIKQARIILQEWVDKQGHERCWYYPDLFKKLADVLEVKTTKAPSLPPIAEFKKGCEKYQEEEYGP